jgi:mannose-6-phosphate isomerase
MLYPFTFRPILKERVWGGRKLQQLFNKPLPPDLPIGESWEISDRPGDVSVINNGPFAGKDLHWLVTNHAKELLGNAKLQNGRFPLLVKILDAREKLSLQVHPPQAMAQMLGGEAKTELWYIVNAIPGAEIYVGLKRGISRKKFEASLSQGTVAEDVHRIPVERGDTMFLPSGRIHAIGEGLVLFEIQQNSDTTYRVFDWNRLGLDGKPRPLQPKESVASINFNDFEPSLVVSKKSPDASSQVLVNDPLFSVQLYQADNRKSMPLPEGKMCILGLVEGGVIISNQVLSLELRNGQFCLIPAGISVEIQIAAGTSFLLVQAGD